MKLERVAIVGHSGKRQSRQIQEDLERWLKAPVSMPDGTLVSRERGSPQGSVVSPVLANLFLHYAFDCWMDREFPDIPFERYADDAICHCRSEAQALELHQALKQRLD